MAPLTDPAAIAADIQRRLAPAKRDPKPRGDSGDQYLDCIPMIQCSDGLKMSVQTGPTHYCQPRNGRGPWRSVEIGFPSRRVEALMEYIDGADSEPTETVYGYVPMDVVASIIAAAGGLLSETAQ